MKLTSAATTAAQLAKNAIASSRTDAGKNPTTTGNAEAPGEFDSVHARMEPTTTMAVAMVTRFTI